MSRGATAKRIKDGTYTPLPVWLTNQSWYQNFDFIFHYHYPHISTEDPMKIAFTESPEKGMADIQTQMKLTRYLTKYLPPGVLTNEDIEAIGGRFLAQFDPESVVLLTKPEDIAAAYIGTAKQCDRSGRHSYGGLVSCMTYHTEYFNLPVHPVSVYGDHGQGIDGTGLVVWYACHSTNKPDAPRNVVARSIVGGLGTDSPYYIRIYAESTQLEHAFAARLKELGYQRRRHLQDAKLAAILVPNSRSDYVMPYVDGDVQRVNLKRASEATGLPAHFVVTDYGEHTVGRTNGSIFAHFAGDEDEDEDEEETFYCPHCEEDSPAEGSRDVVVRFTPSDFRTVLRTWCASCVENDTFRCEATDLVCDIDVGYRDVRSDPAGDDSITVAEPHADRIAFLCGRTDQWYHRANFNAIAVRVSADCTEVWCAEVNTEHFTRHPYTGEYVSNDFTDYDPQKHGGVTLVAGGTANTAVVTLTGIGYTITNTAVSQENTL